MLASRTDPHESPGDKHGTCGGRDDVLLTCTCPDLAYQLRVQIRTGQTFGTGFYCLCCDLPVDPLTLPPDTSARSARR